jgi:hypothetical protein
LQAAAADTQPTPPNMTWPPEFDATFDSFLQNYGPFWKSPGPGVVHYSAKPHMMHSVYTEWCPPMFDNPPFAFNFTCEFLFDGENGTVYYLNPDGL